MNLVKPSQGTMSRLTAALLLLPLLVAACGGGSSATKSPAAGSANPSASASAGPTDAASQAPSTAPSAAPTGPVQQLACNPAGPGWPVTRLDGPADAESGTTPAAKALAAYVTGPDGADLPDTGWRELYRSKDTALYGQDDPSGQPGVLLVATITATNGTWAGTDNGQCKPATWLGSTLGMAASWKLSAKTTTASKTLKLLVTEKACSGGVSAKGRIAKPRIDYESDRVVVTIGVTPVSGTPTCKTNPATALTVTLSEPLGSRQLYDGGQYPASTIAQPK
jgi:hypothetical protein